MRRRLKQVALILSSAIVVVVAIGARIAWTAFFHEQGRAPLHYLAHVNASESDIVRPLLDRDTLFDIHAKLSITGSGDIEKTLFDGIVFANATLSKRSLYAQVPVELPLSEEVVEGRATLTAVYYILPQMHPSLEWRGLHGAALNSRQREAPVLASESDDLTIKDANRRVVLKKRSRIVLSEDVSRYDVKQYRDTFGALQLDEVESQPKAQMLEKFCNGRATKWLDPFRAYHEVLRTEAATGNSRTQLRYATTPYVAKYSAGPLDVVRLENVAREDKEQGANNIYSFDWDIKLDVLGPLQLDWSTSTNCTSTALLRQSSLHPNISSPSEIITAQESYDFYAGFLGDKRYPSSKPLASLVYLGFISFLRRIEWPTELLYWAQKQSNLRGLSLETVLLTLCIDVAIIILDRRTTGPTGLLFLLSLVLLPLLRARVAWRLIRQPKGTEGRAKSSLPLLVAVAFFLVYSALSHYLPVLIPASATDHLPIEAHKEALSSIPITQVLLPSAATTISLLLILHNAYQRTFAGTSRFARLAIFSISLAHLLYAHCEMIGGHRYTRVAYHWATAIKLGLDAVLVVQGFFLYRPV